MEVSTDLTSLLQFLESADVMAGSPVPVPISVPVPVPVPVEAVVGPGLGPQQLLVVGSAGGSKERVV